MQPNARQIPDTLTDGIDGLRHHPDAPALIAFDRSTSHTMSRRQLSEAVISLAKGLSGRHIGQGDLVAVCGPVSTDWIISALAVIKAGAVLIPIDAQMGDRNLAHVLKDSRPSCLFTDEEHRSQLDRLKHTPVPEVFMLQPSEDAASRQDIRGDRSLDLPESRPDEEAVLFYTSGTTGEPKGVPLTHANLAFQVSTIMEHGITTGQDRLLVPLPLHHVYPFVMGLLVPLALSAPIVLPGALTGPQVLRAVQEGKASVMIGVPRLYRALYEGIHARSESSGRMAALSLKAIEGICAYIHRRTNRTPGRWLLRRLHNRIGPQLRLMASGGSPLDPALGKRLESMGWGVAIGYGLTETSPLLSLRLPGRGPLESVGHPVKDVELRIDPGYRGRPHTGDHDHAQGEILARGPGVFHGYRNLPRETEKVLTPEGWFRTGDLGYIDSDGYLHLTGRVSTMIVTEGGENIQPDTVEHMYTDHPLIKEAGVLERNQRLVGLIVPDIREMENRNITGIEKAVRRAVDERSRTMPSYMRLSHVQVTRKALPRTRLGKIRRHLLASRYDDAQEASAPSKGRPVAYDEMSDADRALLEDQTARRVWEWLCERFRDAALTPDTSPRMELNIDSMEWLNLTLEIRARTGVEIGEEAIARVDTVRDLLKEAAEAASNTEPAADPVDSPYEVLTREQQKWVQPLGPGMHILSQCAYWLTSSLLRLLYRIHTQGLEQVPEKRACVLTPNHASYLDPFVLGHVLGPGSMSHTYWAGMTTAAFDTAAKRFGSRLGRGMPIAPRRGALSALAFASVILKRHQRLVWFPEGRRSTDGTLQEFKPGLGKILDTFPVPVVPVWIEGTHEAWPVGRQVPRPGRITILFGEPVAVDTLKSAGDGPHTEQRIMSGLRQRMLALNPAE